MRHGIVVKMPCVKCMVTAQEIISGKIAGGRSVAGNKMNTSRYLEIARKTTDIAVDENEEPQKE